MNVLDAGNAFPKLTVAELQGGMLTLGTPRGANDWQLVVVYRGLHCPICKNYTAKVEALKNKFDELDTDILFVSGDNAVKAKGSADITGTDVRDGFYEIKDYTLGGLLPPLQITRKDHEGGGWVRIFQATKDGYKPNTDWYRAYRAEVRELLEAEIAHTK